MFLLINLFTTYFVLKKSEIVLDVSIRTPTMPTVYDPAMFSILWLSV